MIAMKASEIAAVVGGTLHGDDVLVTKAPAVDSRNAEKGSIFLAIKSKERMLMDMILSLMHSPMVLYWRLPPRK